GAFAGAARDRALELVRAAQPLVAVLEPDREPDRILHAEAAPGRPDARLHRAQRLAVGVAGFEAGGDQLAPDLGPLPDPHDSVIWCRRTRWHSSWRVWAKCSHSRLLSVVPDFFAAATSRSLIRVWHEPQPEPALVQRLTCATSVKRPSLIAPQIVPLVTLWHE